MVGRKALAVEFAEEVAKELKKRATAELLQKAKATQGEAKATAEVVQQYLAKFVKKHAEDLPDGAEPEYIWEGRGEGGESDRGYWLLGTMTHPDSAVVEPFTVAFEFDRERPSGKSSESYSHFKDCLMKAAVHVLSGAYDATVLVYSLERSDSTEATYLNDRDEFIHTGHLMATLAGFGMVVAIVPRQT